MKIKITQLFNWENIYILFISLSLLFHVFNELTFGGGIKVFYVFTAFSIIAEVPLFKRFCAIKKYLLLYLLFSIVACFYASHNASLTIYFTLLMVVVSTFGLSVINKQKVATLVLIYSPIVLGVLFYTLTEYSPFRFQGFYNDPNYLCTSILIFTYFIFQALPKMKNRYIRLILFSELIIIFIILLSTLSRTGLICFFIIALSSFHSYISKSKKTAFVTILAVVGFAYFQQNYIERFLYSMERRSISQDDNIENAASTRFKLSLRGLDYISNHPQYIPFGVGLGGVRKIREISGSDHQIDHNTFTSCLTEQGIFSLIFLLCVIVIISYRLFKVNNVFFSNSQLFSLLSFLVFSMSVNMITYLPFWWLLFFFYTKKKEFARERGRKL